MASPFFIVGSGRCGATWMYFVLREHPEIAMTNEGRVLDFVYFCHELVRVPYSQTKRVAPREQVELRGIVRDPYLDTASSVFLDHAKSIVEEFYEKYFEGRSYRWWGDKLPDPRAALAARRVWPDARYVALIRDPRDVLCSWRAFAKRDNIAANNPELVGLTADVLARSWNAIYRAVPVEVEQPMLLRYEDLRTDPRRHVEEILQFLGLEWCPEVERSLAENDSFGKHGTAATPEASMGRWKGELTDDEVAAIESTCGDVMRQFGYEITTGA